MVKYLKRVSRHMSIKGRYFHQDAGKTWIPWISHNAALYDNFNALPHALSYIISQFNMNRL